VITAGIDDGYGFDGSGSRPPEHLDPLRCLPKALRTELGEFIEGGVNRLKDTLENPLELQHYSAEDIAEMERKRDRGLVLRDTLFAPNGV